MAQTSTVSADVTVKATPEELYALIADPAQMSRWSPENTGAEVSTSEPLRPGDTFSGSNKRGPLRWTTECTVTAAVPGERFAFEVRRFKLKGAPPVKLKIATWEYRFEKVEDGTRVTETWTDDRGWPDLLARALDPVLTGRKSYAAFHADNIRATLDRLKVDVEAH